MVGLVTVPTPVVGTVGSRDDTRAILLEGTPGEGPTLSLTPRLPHGVVQAPVDTDGHSGEVPPFFGAGRLDGRASEDVGPEHHVDVCVSCRVPVVVTPGLSRQAVT